MALVVRHVGEEDDEGDEGGLMLESGQVALHRAFEARRNVVGVRRCAQPATA